MHHFRFVILSLCCVSPVVAAEPGPPLGAKGRLVQSDDFNRPELGDTAWRAGRGIAVADGVLSCEQVNPNHPSVTRMKVDFRDAIIELKFRFRGARSVSFVYDDKLTAPTTHSGHLCRVTVTPDVIRLSDDKEGGMRLDILALKNSGKPEDLQKREQLMEGRTAEAPIKLETDRWYKLTIELVGDELRGSIDDKPLVRLKSPGIAHEIKREFGPSISGKWIDFDDVQVYEVVKP